MLGGGGGAGVLDIELLEDQSKMADGENVQISTCFSFFDENHFKFHATSISCLMPMIFDQSPDQNQSTIAVLKYKALYTVVHHVVYRDCAHFLHRKH